VPALRDRGDDVLQLAEHILGKHQASAKLDDSARNTILRYSFPGNVRELENLIERMLLLSSSNEIGISDLPKELLATAGHAAAQSPRVPATGLSLPTLLKDIETDMIEQALELSHNNKNQAAKLLGLHRTTLLEKMKKRGL